MIEACQEVFDLRRSQEWTRALSAWCDAQPEMIPFTGQCLVHRAELLVLHGAWEEALNEANRAAALAAQAGDRPAIASAHYVLGEIHRLRGEHDDALARLRERAPRRTGSATWPGVAAAGPGRSGRRTSDAATSL